MTQPIFQDRAEAEAFGQRPPGSLAAPAFVVGQFPHDIDRVLSDDTGEWYALDGGLYVRLTSSYDETVLAEHSLRDPLPGVLPITEVKRVLPDVTWVNRPRQPISWYLTAAADLLYPATEQETRPLLDTLAERGFTLKPTKALWVKRSGRLYLLSLESLTAR